ncbi:MAG TPA: hypothetical protein DCY80_09130 [Solibacterales bacterium]|nr:hypothetical protein [Bryobacterales bacterium]
MLINREPELQPEDFPFQASPVMAAEGRRLEDIEKVHIERVLTESGWNLSRSARVLGIDRTTLYNKIKRYNLRGEDAGTPARD